MTKAPGTGDAEEKLQGKKTLNIKSMEKQIGLSYLRVTSKKPSLSRIL